MANAKINKKKSSKGNNFMKLLASRKKMIAGLVGAVFIGAVGSYLVFFSSAAVGTNLYNDYNETPKELKAGQTHTMKLYADIPNPHNGYGGGSRVHANVAIGYSDNRLSKATGPSGKHFNCSGKLTCSPMTAADDPLFANAGNPPVVLDFKTCLDFDITFTSSSPDQTRISGMEVSYTAKQDGRYVIIAATDWGTGTCASPGQMIMGGKVGPLVPCYDAYERRGECEGYSSNDSRPPYVDPNTENDGNGTGSDGPGGTRQDPLIPRSGTDTNNPDGVRQDPLTPGSNINQEVTKTTANSQRPKPGIFDSPQTLGEAITRTASTVKEKATESWPRTLAVVLVLVGVITGIYYWRKHLHK